MKNIFLGYVYLVGSYSYFRKRVQHREEALHVFQFWMILTSESFLVRKKAIVINCAYLYYMLNFADYAILSLWNYRTHCSLQPSELPSELRNWIGIWAHGTHSCLNEYVTEVSSLYSRFAVNPSPVQIPPKPMYIYSSSFVVLSENNRVVLKPNGLSSFSKLNYIVIHWALNIFNYPILVYFGQRFFVGLAGRIWRRSW